MSRCLHLAEEVSRENGTGRSTGREHTRQPRKRCPSPWDLRPGAPASLLSRSLSAATVPSAWDPELRPGPRKATGRTHNHSRLLHARHWPPLTPPWLAPAPTASRRKCLASLPVRGPVPGSRGAKPRDHGRLQALYPGAGPAASASSPGHEKPRLWGQPLEWLWGQSAIRRDHRGGSQEKCAHTGSSWTRSPSRTCGQMTATGLHSCFRRRNSMGTSSSRVKTPSWTTLSERWTQSSGSPGSPWAGDLAAEQLQTVCSPGRSKWIRARFCL
ncbi:uncharacterized protein LOC108312544 [Cebus imitator]|uniref:uncharacterized protein LOC108312544 n=1 Tax=Cebus imitator TaxID=2715852 RepID=UPI0018999BC4|nr:uncharacterized protein LOC108312544 [Cebus imitator]